MQAAGSDHFDFFYLLAVSMEMAFLFLSISKGML